MVDNEQQQLEQKLALLNQGYQQNLQAELVSLRQVIEDLQGRLDPTQTSESCDTNLAAVRTLLDDMNRRLHKIAGSAGTFGWDAIGSRARVLEASLTPWLEENTVEADQPLLDMLDQELYAMQQELAPCDQHIIEAFPKPSNAHTPASIWLIEENAEPDKRIFEQLTNFSYEVKLFSTVAEAQVSSENTPPDVVVVDATPGLESLLPLKTLGCPLLFISDQDGFEDRIKAAQLNAHGYFLKPLNIPQLVSRLEQLLQERSAPPARILIVDDDYQLAAYYQLVLEAARMEVRILDHPRQIIEELGSFRPELLLMDVHMPEYDGPDLASVVRQYDEWSSLPIVFLSAETDLNKQVDALSHGADDFLTKPISAAQLVASVRARVARARTLSALLNKDSLTGLLKHASIKSAAINEIARAYRQGYPLVVAMLDIDHFKNVNDTYGHAVGDVVIASVATLLRQRLRQTDLIGRYGGEEFLIVLSHCGEQDGWKRLEDVRKYFAKLRFNQGEQEFACTLSAGMVCSRDATEEQRSNLLIAADEALYRAKRSGRNQVCN